MTKKREVTIPSSIASLQPIAKKHGKDVYLDNPFVESFSVEVRKKSLTVAAGLSVTDRDNNEVNVGAVATFQEVDTEEFIKIYTQNIKHIFELSGTAKKVLQPLMLEIQKTAKNVAHVYFSLSDAQKRNNELGLDAISKTTFNRGMNELIENYFIAINAKGVNWYWINPSILFNGDRIRFIKDYRIKRTGEQLKLL